MKSLPEQLKEYLASVYPAHVSSGELQRMKWKNRDGTEPAPRTVVRRLEELAEDKTLSVDYREKNHAWYAFGSVPKPKTAYFITDRITGERVQVV